MLRKLLILLFLPLTFYSQREINIVKKIDSLILSRYNLGLFNGSVLVQRNGEIIYERALGWANVEKGDTLSIDDPMRIASITKTFTAVCILKLVDEGKLQLNEDINTYLPEIEKTGITIHHLLSHSSGIAYINGGNHFRKMKKYQKERGDKRWTNDDVIRYFKEFKPKKQKEVGEEHSYSNISFSILASLIERVSSIKYAKYLEENIFKPFNMDNSLLYLPENKQVVNPEDVKSYRYHFKKRKHIKPYYKYDKQGNLVYSNDIYGDKYICSTVGDMNRFNTALLKGEIISSKMLTKMQTPVLLNNGEPSSDKYGYGLYRSIWLDSAAFQHGGNLAAFESVNYFDKEGNQVILLMSLGLGQKHYIYTAIVDFMNGENGNRRFSEEYFGKKNKKSEQKYKNIFQKKYSIDYKPINN